MTGDATETIDQSGAAGPDRGPALVVAWSLEEPERVGERLLFDPGRTVVLGRGPARPDDPHPRTWPVRVRPGAVVDGGPLTARTLSRVQATVARRDGALHVHSRGRAAMLHDGRPADHAVVYPGSTLAFEGRLLLLCVEDTSAWPDLDLRVHPFGERDVHGIVGESAAAWALRRQLAFVGPRHPHVLILGPSGAGKELAARAVHRLSTRRARPLVDRNAATLPEGLVDAELFGHARNYPNPGMPERRGLIGEADGGTLFLDEIAELPHPSQAHLLRVLDDGRYTRLGEPGARTADVRLLAATNRAAAELKHDLRARLRLVVQVPGLDERPEDIPLLLRHLLRRILERDPALTAQLPAPPSFSLAFVDAALRHPWTTHVRELEAWIWQALSASTDGALDPPAVNAPAVDAPDDAPVVAWERWVGTDPAELPAAVVDACLRAHNGNQQQAAAALGLTSRHVIRRLIKRHGLAVVRQG